MKSFLGRAAVLGCAMSAPACAGGQSGTEGDPTFECEVASSSAVGPDDDTELGTPREAAEGWPSESRGSLVWFPWPRGSAPARTPLVVRAVLELDGARYVRARDVATAPGACPDHLALIGTLAFETEDGAFRERLSGVFKALPESVRAFEGAIPLSEMQGSYAASALDELPAAHFVVETWWQPELWGVAFARDADRADTIGTFAGDPPASDAGPR